MTHVSKYASYTADYDASGRLSDIRVIHAGAPALPVDDRGFLYGDALFETVRFGTNGCVPYASYHHARLKYGCRALRIPAPDIDVVRIARLFSRKNTIHSGILRLHVSAGSGGAGYARPRIFKGRCVLSFRPLPSLRRDAALYVMPPAFFCPIPGSSHIKHTQRAAYCVGVSVARMKGYDDALFIDKRGYMAECGSSNIFVVYGRSIVTPPLSSGALAGTCRARIIARAGRYVREAPVHISAIRHADAVFMANACTGVRRIYRIDGQGIHYRVPAARISAADILLRRLFFKEEAAYASA